MKKAIILTVTSLVLCTAGVFAANPGARDIATANRKIEQRGDTVYVEFDVEVGMRAARSGHTVIYRPYLVNGDYRWDMPEVVVYNKRASVAEQRHEWVSGEKVVYDDPTMVGNGDTFRYSAAVPRQGWMKGANLEVELIDMSCCAADINVSDILAQNIELPTPMGIISIGPDSAIDVVEEPVVAEPVVPKTTGDRLAQEMPFVLHASEFESTHPELMFDDDREGALRVYFAVGSSVLDHDRRDNARTLRQLLRAIRHLQDAPDSRVEHVVVAGFASPEGSFQLNDRLAWNRASILKRYIARNSTLDDEIIHIYNGVEDWYGLRMLVEKSDLENKDEIMDIIENVPIWDPVGRTGRDEELRKLDGGATYLYMLQHFYPELRAAAYIKVYYDNVEENTNDEDK